MFPNDVVGCQNRKSRSIYAYFKVKGQIYQKAGSLLPFSDENHKFLQLYFFNDRNSELNARCKISPDFERKIVSQLQHLFHENNNLVRLLKTAIDVMIDAHKVVISAAKTPPGQHVRRYNAPTIDEVAMSSCCSLNGTFTEWSTCLFLGNQRATKSPESTGYKVNRFLFALQK